jgi:hypothetical protein
VSNIPTKNPLKQKPKRYGEKRQLQKYKEHRPSSDFSTLIDAIKSEGRAYRNEEQREDRGKKFREWVTIGFIGFTFLAICYQVHEMVKVYEPIKEQADASKIAADGTIRAADAATKQSENSDKALVVSSRAWVGPVDAKIVGIVELEKPVKIVISVRNTGRQPAKNFRWIPEHFIGAGDDDFVVDQKVNTSMKFCMGTPDFASGQVVFPSTGFGSGADYTIEFSKDEIDEGVIAGDKFLVAQGCIAYESFGFVRHSAFCYLFKNKTTTPEHLAICGNGSDAD